MDFAFAKRARRAESPFFAGKIDDVLFKRREPVIHSFSPCLSPPKSVPLDSCPNSPKFVANEGNYGFFELCINRLSFIKTFRSVDTPNALIYTVFTNGLIELLADNP